MAAVAVGVLRTDGADVPGQGDRLRRRADRGGRGRRDLRAPRPRGPSPDDVPGRLDRRPGALARLAAGDGLAARHRCAGALDDARDRPPGGPPDGVRRRTVVGVRAEPVGPGAALDAAGLGRGLALAPSRLWTSRTGPRPAQLPATGGGRG